MERGGRSLLSFTDEHAELQAAAEALAGGVHEGWLGTLAVERADGVGSLGSALADVLTEGEVPGDAEGPAAAREGVGMAAGEPRSSGGGKGG